MATKLAKVLKKERPDHIYLKKVFAHIRDDLGLRGRVGCSEKNAGNSNRRRAEKLL